MQIILLEKVVNLGQLGEVVKVRNGYARNYLIPEGKARRATKQAIEEFELRRAELERLQAEKLSSARGLGERLDGTSLQMTEKAGVDGRLFGSVTTANIAEALRAKGLDVQKAMVRLPAGPLKTIGDHEIEIAPHSDVVCKVTVTIVGDAS